MKKVDGKILKERFELDGKYIWDWTDLIALVYILGTALTIAGLSLAGAIILWAGALISLITTIIYSKRINLLIIGITIAVLDTYFVIIGIM